MNLGGTPSCSIDRVKISTACVGFVLVNEWKDTGLVGLCSTCEGTCVWTKSIESLSINMVAISVRLGGTPSSTWRLQLI